jgi:hypothetical protein
MATTEAKPGFRLPWSSDRSGSADPADTDAAATGGETSNPQQEIETPEMIDATPAATDNEAVVESTAPADPAQTVEAAAPPAASKPPVAPATAKKPNKFMADLTKAMQAAAETARGDSLAKFAADAKTHIETIHADSATDATELRKQADDDVAAIRDWSKAEIARIREETDERIAHRKTTLEHEIEEHAAAIEARIERVQARVDAFEAEMAAFFERLLAEEDPTRFAAMAESLPEPPPFDGPAPERPAEWYATPTSEAAPAAEAAQVADEPAVADPAETAEPANEQAGSDATPAAEWGAPETTAETTTAAEPDPAWTAEPAAEEDAPTEAAPAATDDAGDLFSIADAPDAAGDPRLSALGIAPDFAAAEAEAADFTSEGSSNEDLPEIAEEAIAARLTGLVPDGDAGASVTTRVVVTGLISVASIAGFKRHLSRADGVQSVGVSSGPDGEFVFAVSHGADVSLGTTIPTLPGFNARVTAESDGELTVAASDPEAEN